MAKEKKAVDYNSELWKPISGYSDYQISSLGRVRSLEKRIHVAASAAGCAFVRTQREKLLRPIGNACVTLYRRGIPKRMGIPRLVALAFIGKPPKGKPYVLHGDDDRTNNQVGNLRWGSHQDNMDDKTLRDRQVKGTAVSISVLRPVDVRKIRKLLLAGNTHASIADAFNISKSTVGQIHRGVTWVHIK